MFARASGCPPPTDLHCHGTLNRAAIRPYGLCHLYYLFFVVTAVR